MAATSIARPARKARRLTWAKVRNIYRRHLGDTPNRARLLSALAFLATFIGARVVTHLQLALGGERAGGAGAGGTPHIHHMVFGVILLLVAVLLDHADALKEWRMVTAGIGAALVLDEFALMLNLADVYWQPQGRESIDAVIIFGAILFAVVAARDFGSQLWRAFRS